MFGGVAVLLCPFGGGAVLVALWWLRAAFFVYGHVLLSKASCLCFLLAFCWLPSSKLGAVSVLMLLLCVQSAAVLRLQSAGVGARWVSGFVVSLLLRLISGGACLAVLFPSFILLPCFFCPVGSDFALVRRSLFSCCWILVSFSVCSFILPGLSLSLVVIVFCFSSSINGRAVRAYRATRQHHNRDAIAKMSIAAEPALSLP
jgi:hypothetical protein